MEAFHGSLGTSLLQGIDYSRFEDTPVIEGPNPEEMNQREEFFNFVLATVKVRDLGTTNGTLDLTWEYQ